MSRDKARHFDFRPDEYIAGVGGVLNPFEQAIYWMVCSLVMSRGGPIPEDAERLGHLCKMRRAQVRQVLDALVDKHEKLHRIDGQLSNNRAQSEVDKATNRIATASENGSKGGRPRKKPEEKQQPEKPGGSSGEKLTTNDQRSTINDEAPSGASVSPAFDPFDDPLRPSRMDADAPLPPAWRTWADTEGLAEIDHHWRQFTCHYASLTEQQGYRRDWLLVWRKWASEEARRQKRPARAGPAGGGIVATLGQLAHDMEGGDRG